jgi:predicted nucleic acid-binding protein
MIVVDSSAWIELFRATESRADRTLTRLLAEEAPLAVTEIVVAEVLAGARNELDHHRLRRSLLSCRMLPLGGLAGFESAAKLSQRCRRRGISPSVADCLVASPALKADAQVLHVDGDFDAIASVTGLAIHPLDPV